MVRSHAARVAQQTVICVCKAGRNRQRKWNTTCDLFGHGTVTAQEKRQEGVHRGYHCCTVTVGTVSVVVVVVVANDVLVAVSVSVMVPYFVLVTVLVTTGFVVVRTVVVESAVLVVVDVVMNVAVLVTVAVADTVEVRVAVVVTTFVDVDVAVTVFCAARLPFALAAGWVMVAVTVAIENVGCTTVKVMVVALQERAARASTSEKEISTDVSLRVG